MNGLTLRTPKGASCSLFEGAPTSTNYFRVIAAGTAIAPSAVDTAENTSSYIYRDLKAGLYHYGVSLEGHTAVCQVLLLNEKALAAGCEIDVELLKMAGNGYESGFVMLNSPAFIEHCLASEKTTWGAEYAHLFATPQFGRRKDLPGYHQQTTNEEIRSFIRALQPKNEYMHVFSLGKTPKYGFEMPLVLFTREQVRGKTLAEAAEILRQSGKPTVQYMAQVHSNEPASTEGALAMMLDLTSGHMAQLLDTVNVYIIPRINLDGAVEVIREAPATGEDMNRDYLFANNKEVRMVNAAYNLFLPEVVVDGHEKRSNFITPDEARCTDMELQVGAGALNHPANMTSLAMDMALTAIRWGRELGLRTHFYQSFASAMGGSAGDSYYGARNSLAFLVETPGGTTLGRFCMERRVMAQYVLAASVIRYTAEHAKTVLDTVHGSRARLAAMGHTYNEENLIVLEHGRTPTGTLPTTMIDVPTGNVTNEALITDYDEHTEAIRTRTRATAYVIPCGLPLEARILEVVQNHAIPYTVLPQNAKAMLCQYTYHGEEAALLDEREISFPDGAYVFPNTVPSTVLSVIMEPDFNAVSKRKMTLYSMELITADENGALPLYRYCRDLVNGSITLA